VARADHFTIVAAGIKVALDLSVGHVASFEVTREGRTTAPFHRAPWADEPEVAGTEGAPHLARLSGDFFCAPFGAADVEPAPSHGWPANARWEPLGVTAVRDGVTARFALERPVMRARVLKELTLRDGHPFLYQRHIFEGGAGAIPVANHAMVRLLAGGRLSFSPKRRAETPATPLEGDPSRGRSILAYPAQSPDLARFPRADGATADLTRYPVDEAHEDFVMLVEAAGAALGWSAVLREDEADLALFLKNPARLPVTMLWFSNGGRSYAPWNGRHRGVLGIEDGCTWSLNGHAASTAENPLSREGIPTAIRCGGDRPAEVRHVIGAAPVGDGFGPVDAIDTEPGRLIVRGKEGAVVLPFDTEFLSEES
jgi:hypothetical protein